MKKLALLLFAAVAAVAAGEYVEDGDLARRYGVAESVIAKSPSRFKVECAVVEDEEDFFSRFRDYDEVVVFLHQLENVRVVEIGKSFEGRPIYAVEVGPTSSPTVLVMAGVHGREWTSIAAVLFALHDASLQKQQDPADVRTSFIPIVNPDGYAKTFTGRTHVKEKWAKGELVREEDVPNRYFRKNAHGVDLNRNFPARWGEDRKTKSLKLKLADVYQGPEALSEPETAALHKYATTSLGDSLVGVLDFHCCIGAVLAAAGGGNEGESLRVGRLVVQALSEAGRGVTRTVKGGDGEPGAYVWRPRDDQKDRGAGLSSSWAYHTLAVDWALVVELRGKFVAPCFEIKQLGKEAVFGVRAMVKEAKKSAVVVPLEERRRRRQGGADTPTPPSWYRYQFVGSILVLLLVVFLFTASRHHQRKQRQQPV